MADNLAELKARAGAGGFSAEEIDQFITLGKRLASKPVLALVGSMISEARDRDPTTAYRLINRLKKATPYDHVYPIQVEFTETTMRLNITLTLAARDYKTEVDLPSASYVRDLFNKYDFLKNVAAAYWRQFAADHKDLYDAICEFLADVDMSTLKIEPNHKTTMYFSETSAQRVGILCYYVDSRGTVYRKRS